MKSPFTAHYHVVPVSGQDALFFLFVAIILIATWVWLKDLMDNN